MTETNTIHHAIPLPPGKEAPDFELSATPDQKVMLSEFRGQPVILAFYPEDWIEIDSPATEVAGRLRQLGSDPARSPESPMDLCRSPLAEGAPSRYLYELKIV